MSFSTVAYKVLLAGELNSLIRDGSFAGAPIDLADGYIHLSTAEQVDETVAKYFADRDDVHVAAVDLNALRDLVRWEPSRGGALFPHVYGPLPLSAVIGHQPLARDPQGKVALP